MCSFFILLPDVMFEEMAPFCLNLIAIMVLKTFKRVAVSAFQGVADEVGLCR